MSETVLSFAEYDALVRAFAQQVPEILSRHSLTAGLADAVRQLRICDTADMRFTVAIVGQMRAGKSTLLNALIGQDLAPTGVTETTATVNWFRYGTGDLCKIFRVHWKDGSTEDFPLSSVAQWIGTAENATNTSAIDYFADVEFLKNVNIVDTPGLRSVVTTHENTTQTFLAEKCENETLLHGGRADAVLYVLNPVGRENDSDTLQIFGARTRLQGSSPNNSLAVIQIWEHLEPDPVDEVAHKIDRLGRSDQLGNKVAKLISTSGLLARVTSSTSNVTDEDWAHIAEIGSRSTAVVLSRLLLSDHDFSTYPKCPLSTCTRKAILANIPWPILRLALGVAQRQALTDGELLRKRLYEISGIDNLKQTLHHHFFSRARLIQSCTTMKKAWDPCNEALLKLKQHMEHVDKLGKYGADAATSVGQLLKSIPSLAHISTYVHESLTYVQLEQNRIDSIAAELDAIMYKAEYAFRFLDNDIKYLDVLQYVDDSQIPLIERTQLTMLFGQKGIDAWSRMGLSAQCSDRNIEIMRLNKMYDKYSKLRLIGNGTVRLIYEHALEVVDKIISYLEGDDEQHNRN